MDGQPTQPKRLLHTSWLPQSVRDWLEWRRIVRDLKSKGLPTDSPLRWMEWHRVNIAGRDAYYSGRHEEAQDRFVRLITITREIGDRRWMRLLDDMTDSSRWWQAQIVRVGVGYWNNWRRANPGIPPNLSQQGLSLENPDPPYPLERKDMLSYLPCINFSNANLTSACWSGPRF